MICLDNRLKQQGRENFEFFVCRKNKIVNKSMKEIGSIKEKEIVGGIK